MGVTVQILASFLISWLCISLGIVISWPSSTLHLFESQNTTLTRPMSGSELALLGSLCPVGALVGTPVVGFLLDRQGRKRCAVFFSLFGVISWALISTCRSVEVVLASMFISGLYGASYLIVPVYISEICQESIRGAMTSFAIVGIGVGLLFSYIMGGWLTYHAKNYVCLSISVSLTAALMWLKESPTFLTAKGRENDAIQSIAFYRSLRCDSKEVQDELSKIKRTLKPDKEETPEENEKLNPVEVENEKFSFWKFMKQSKSSRRAFFITVTLFTSSVLQGPLVLQVYAGPIFKKAMPSISADLASIILAVVTIVAGLVASLLVEKVGRRSMMIASTFTMAVLCVLLGTQLHLQWGPSWMVAVYVYLFMAVFTFGSGTIPYVFMAEVLLPQVKSYISMITIEWGWFCSSIALFIFNPLLKVIGLGPVFYLFAGVAASTGVFCIAFMPETKGLLVDEIQLRLVKRRKGRDIE